MRLHTSLSYGQVHDALRQAKDAGQVTPDVTFEVFTCHGSRTHPRAFEVQLGTSDKYSLPEGYRDQYGKLMRVRRYKNTGDRGASSDWATGGCAVWSATWHEWGWFMARVFAMDPDARFGSEKGWHYAGFADFMTKTKDAFDLEPSPEKRPVFVPGDLLDDGFGQSGVTVTSGDQCATRTARFTGQVVCTRCAPDCDHYVCTDEDNECAINHDTIREQTGEDA